MSALISAVTGLKTPTAWNSKHSINDNMPQPDRLVGIELEIEEFDPEASRSFGGFKFETDGSLRSSMTGVGIEAITLPVAMKAAPGMLAAFFGKYGITDRNYSERCSVHVHVNVLDMNAEQLATLGLLYQTVERLLFEFVDENRRNSIFCVPWYQSGLTYNYVSSIVESTTSTRNWQKYSALNLLPVFEQGSVEFRHMQGTCDIQKLTVWLALIGKLFDIAVSKPLDQVKEELFQMNTVSNYREWLVDTFGQYADHFLALPHYEQALFRGVVDSKFMLSAPSKQEKPWSNVDLENMLREAQQGQIAPRRAINPTHRFAAPPAPLTAAQQAAMNQMMAANTGTQFVNTWATTAPPTGYTVVHDDGLLDETDEGDF